MKRRDEMMRFKYSGDFQNNMLFGQGYNIPCIE